MGRFEMEKDRNLGKNGYVWLYDEFDGEFSKNLREFLLDTVSNFAKETLVYLKTEDSDLYPFIYNELVLCSVLLPSLKNASDTSIVLTEYPIDRKKGYQSHDENKEENNTKSGRVDYYILHKDKDILLEVKFGWISYNAVKQNHNVRQDILNKLEIAAKQIKDIDWDNSIKIAMIVSPVYFFKTVETEEDFENKTKNIDWDNFEKIYNDYFKKISEKVKEVLGKKTQPFLISWDIPKFANYYWCWDKDNGNMGCEVYPTIFFIGAVLK